MTPAIREYVTQTTVPLHTVLAQFSRVGAATSSQGPAALEGVMHRALTFIALIPLSGCALSHANRTSPTMRATNLDPRCAEVARWRAVDAARNGYDEDIQRRIYRESFDACRASPATFTEIAPPAEEGSVAGR